MDNDGYVRLRIRMTREPAPRLGPELRVRVPSCSAAASSTRSTARTAGPAELAPSIGETYRGMVLSFGSAGEWGEAVWDLVGALSEEDVAITVARKETLRELLLFQQRPLDRLDRLRATG